MLGENGLGSSGESRSELPIGRWLDHFVIAVGSNGPDCPDATQARRERLRGPEHYPRVREHCIYVPDRFFASYPSLPTGTTLDSYERAVQNFGGARQPGGSDPFYSALTLGLSLVTLMKLYDLDVAAQAVHILRFCLADAPSGVRVSGALSLDCLFHDNGNLRSREQVFAFASLRLCAADEYFALGECRKICPDPGQEYREGQGCQTLGRSTALQLKDSGASGLGRLLSERGAQIRNSASAGRWVVAANLEQGAHLRQLDWARQLSCAVADTECVHWLNTGHRVQLDFAAGSFGEDLCRAYTALGGGDVMSLAAGFGSASVLGCPGAVPGGVVVAASAGEGDLLAQVSAARDRLLLERLGSSQWLNHLIIAVHPGGVQCPTGVEAAEAGLDAHSPQSYSAARKHCIAVARPESLPQLSAAQRPDGVSAEEYLQAARDFLGISGQRAQGLTDAEYSTVTIGVATHLLMRLYGLDEASTAVSVLRACAEPDAGVAAFGVLSFDCLFDADGALRTVDQVLNLGSVARVLPITPLPYPRRRVAVTMQDRHGREIPVQLQVPISRSFDGFNPCGRACGAEPLGRHLFVSASHGLLGGGVRLGGLALELQRNVRPEGDFFGFVGGGGFSQGVLAASYGRGGFHARLAQDWREVTANGLRISGRSSSLELSQAWGGARSRLSLSLGAALFHGGRVHSVGVELDQVRDWRAALTWRLAL